MDLPEIIDRLEKQEGSLISLLQEVRLLKAEIQKIGNGVNTLEPLLEAAHRQEQGAADATIKGNLQLLNALSI